MKAPRVRGFEAVWLEREKGFEPSTSTLARLHSTTELFPHCLMMYATLVRVVNPRPRKREAAESNQARQDSYSGVLIDVSTRSVTIPSCSRRRHRPRRGGSSPERSR